MFPNTTMHTLFVILFMFCSLVSCVRNELAGISYAGKTVNDYVKDFLLVYDLRLNSREDIAKVIGSKRAFSISKETLETLNAVKQPLSTITLNHILTSFFNRLTGGREVRVSESDLTCPSSILDDFCSTSYSKSTFKSHRFKASLGYLKMALDLEHWKNVKKTSSPDKLPMAVADAFIEYYETAWPDPCENITGYALLALVVIVVVCAFACIPILVKYFVKRKKTKSDVECGGMEQV